MINLIKEKRNDKFITEDKIQKNLNDLKNEIKKIEIKTNELEEKTYETFKDFYDSELKNKDSKIKEIKIYS